MWDNAIVELGVGKMDMTKVASWWLLTCWFLEPELILVRWYGGVLLHKNIYWSVQNKVTELETSQQTPGTQYLGKKCIPWLVAICYWRLLAVTVLRPRDWSVTGVMNY